MTIFQGAAAKGIEHTPAALVAGSAMTRRYNYVFTAAPAIGDIVELACLPAGNRPHEVVIDSDDMDSNGTPLITFDVGMMSGAWGDPDQARTCDNVFKSGSQIARTGGVDRPITAAAYRVAPDSNKHRSIGAKITAVAATFVPGEIGITLTHVA